MRILVTGGAGYVGSHTAQQLRLSGHEPVVFDDLSMGHREFARFGAFEFGSILDEARLAEVLRAHRIEAVVHCAAKALVAEGARIPEKYLQINVGGAVTLLAAMKAAGVMRLIFSSSAAVYGEGTGSPLKEDDPKLPVNVYGLSKLHAEQAIAAAGPSFGLRWAVLRFFNVIGCDPAHGLWEWHVPETHLIPNLWNAAQKRRPFQLFGTDYPTADGTAVRDYVDVRDLAAIHVEALEALEQTPSLTCNVGRGTGISVKTVVEAAQKTWQRPVDVQALPRRSGDPAMLVADNSLLLTWSRLAKRGFRSMEESLQSVAEASKTD